MQDKITDIRVNKIYDSNGGETIKIILYGENFTGSYSVPKINSDKNVVLPPEEAMSRILTIVKPQIVGSSCYEQKLIDEKLIEIDNTPNFSHLGINSILGISLATARLSSHERKSILAQHLGGTNSWSFPIPLVGTFTGSDRIQTAGIKEFFLIPLDFTSLKEAIYAVQKVNTTIDRLLVDNKNLCDFNEDGLIRSPFRTTAETLEFLTDAIEKAGYRAGIDIACGIDAAADELYDEKEKVYTLDNMKLRSEEFIDYWDDLSNSYPLLIIEDPLSKEDCDSWHEMMKRFSHRLFIAGDQMFRGSMFKIKDGYTHLLNNSVVVNPGMFGTLTRFYSSLNYAKTQGIISLYKTYNGETADSFDSDLCLGSNIPFFQAGPLKRAEKTGKYNRLLELNDLLYNSEYAYKYLCDRDVMRNFLRKYKENVD